MTKATTSSCACLAYEAPLSPKQLFGKETEETGVPNLVQVRRIPSCRAFLFAQKIERIHSRFFLFFFSTPPSDLFLLLSPVTQKRFLIR